MDKRHETMLSKIRNGAVHAFGTDEADLWMSKKWRVFQNKSPIEMADSANGTEVVLDYIKMLAAADASQKRRSAPDSEH